MTPERFRRMRGVLERRQLDLTVLMENVHKLQNYSAILRTADAVGVHRVHAITTDKLVGKHFKTSASAAKWVGVDIHDTISDAAHHLKSQGFRIVAADLGEHAQDYRALDYTQPTALLVGAEKDGVTAEARAQADLFVEIPMVGLVQSLNVSVATALILFEAQRQRREAGFYEKVQLDEEALHRTLFEWSRPKIASYCRARSLPYPRLDEEGELLEDFREKTTR